MAIDIALLTEYSQLIPTHQLQAVKICNHLLKRPPGCTVCQALWGAVNWILTFSAPPWRDPITGQLKAQLQQVSHWSREGHYMRDFRQFSTSILWAVWAISGSRSDARGTASLDATKNIFLLTVSGKNTPVKQKEPCSNHWRHVPKDQESACANVRQQQAPADFTAHHT